MEAAGAREPTGGSQVSVLNKIAYSLNRRDEVPNEQLAAELAKTKNIKGIRKIAENLDNANQNIRADCLKVLYELGYTNPRLASPYAAQFLSLLKAKNNRLVWGAMIALSTIAAERSALLASHVDEIIDAMAKGSVITVDNGIKTLAVVASKEGRTRARLVPLLIDHLRTCRAKEVPQHSENILVAIDAESKSEFIGVLESRQREYSPSQGRRVGKVIRQARAL
jgi:hypothetical protein